MVEYNTISPPQLQYYSYMLMGKNARSVTESSMCVYQYDKEGK